MAGRQRATFQKRQKEVKRLEKQRMKAEKRAAKKLVQTQTRESDVPEINPAEEATEETLEE
jgi:hypothetical protein